ncbi:MAG: type II toxin-antitoxin system RelE/ParE family toxin [Rubrobacter sp.]|nr:type II toxin-antitoxin system RelE/ParE family toxin [Rubrobacter sp.]
MYEIVFKQKGRRAVARLPESVHGRVMRAIDSLAENPRPTGCRRLRGRKDWRVRVGDYRIIYGIDDDRRIVEILSAAHRREIHR